MRYICLLFAAVIVVFGGHSDCLAQTAPLAGSGDAIELPEGVVATVNGEPISEEEWVEALKRVAGRSVLEFMVRHKVVHQAASERGIELSEAELQTIFDRKVVEAGGVANLRSYLARIGESLEDFRARLKTETLLRKMAESGVTVSSDELRRFYLEKFGRRAEIQAIVTDSREEAERALGRVREGADFGHVASAVSIERTTAENHGYIPVPLTEGIFPKPLGGIIMTESVAEEIFALEPGTTTDIIEGSGDVWYIFRLSRIEPASDVRLEDVEGQVREFAMEYKVQTRAARILQELLNSAVIKLGI